MEVEAYARVYGHEVRSFVDLILAMDIAWLGLDTETEEEGDPEQ